MRRAVLVLLVALALANLAVVVIRKQKHEPRPVTGTLALFNEAVRHHDYLTAYGYTDLGDVQIPLSSSAITSAHFTAFEQAHPLHGLALSGGILHVPTTNLRLTATTGPLPSLAVDGVGVPLRAQPVQGGHAPAAWRYTYTVVVISGPHSLAVGPGPVTASRALTGVFRGDAASLDVSLAASAAGNNRAAAALRSVVGTCPDDLCVFTPCSGGGSEIVVDAWGIGTPPVVARDLVGDRVIAPMPPNGWSMAITFLDQGQPPGLSGKEHTKQVRAQYVFGFVGSARPRLLDRCWVSVH